MLKDLELISVIIPSYNRANTISMTIESILNQEGIGSQFKLEIVIGDDCSTDNAREILSQYHQKYPDIIRLFFRESNVGLGANWAMCVKDCKGKYICNCDNDDYWHNQRKLLLQLDYMESHPACNICITNHRTHNRVTGEIKEHVVNLNHKENMQDEIYSCARFCNATIMYRANFMKAHLDLDEFIRRRLSLQDWPALVILTAYTCIDVIPVSTATFGIETVSITRPCTYEAFQRRCDRDREVCAYLGELFPDKYPYSDDMWQKYQNKLLMNMAFSKLDFVAAKRYGRNTNKCFKQIISQNLILFKSYCLLSYVKRLFK